jgi:PAS domain S-box-containing protein
MVILPSRRGPAPRRPLASSLVAAAGRTPRRWAGLLALALLVGAATARAEVGAPTEGPAAVDAASLDGLGAPGPVGMPAVANYRPPSNPQIWAVAQERSGLMLFGNRDGVLVYDGSGWEKVPMPNMSTVRSLAVGEDGRIWVGAQTELGYLAAGEDGRLVFTSVRDRLAEPDRKFADVWKTWVLGDGVYFQGNGQIFHYRPRTGTMEVLRPTRGSFHFSHQVGDRLYVLERDVGLLEVAAEGERRVLRPVPGGEAFAADRVYAVLPLASDRAGSPALAVVTRDRGIFLLEAGRVAPLLTAVDELLRAASPYHAIVLPDGNWAIATLQAGVVVLDPAGNLVMHLDRRSGLQDNNVKYLFLDRDANLWLGLDKGPARIELFAPLAYLGEREGLSGLVAATARLADRLYVATSAGVYRLLPTSGREAVFLPVEGLDLATFDLRVVGDQLMAAANDGVFAVLPAASRDGADRSEVVTGGTALALLPARGDPRTLYVAQLNGLRVLRRAAAGRWEDRGVVPGAEMDLRSLHETADGRIWAGTNHLGSAVRFSFPPDGSPAQATVEIFGEAEGLPRGRVTVHELWGKVLFSSESGLYRFDEPSRRFVRELALGAEYGDGSTWVTDVAEGPDGVVWLVAGPSRGQGVVRALTADGRPAPGVWGLRRLLSDSIFSLDVGSDGVWIGTDQWLVRYAPDRARPLPSVPRVRLREVSAGERELWPARPTASPPVVPWDANDVRVAASLPAYADEASNEFRFWLQGAEDRWSRWSAEAVRYYGGLREGQYRLHVQGRDVFGRLSEEATFAFVVEPPWFRTRFALAAYLAGLIGLVLLADRLRARGHERRERELAELVARRTAELGKSEERYRSLIDHASDLILVVDTGGRLHAVNRACEITLGYSRDELLGRRLQELVPPRDLGLLFEWLQAVDPSAVGTLELELERKDGERVVVELRTTPLPSTGGPQLLEAIGRDVTTRRQLEARLMETQKMEAVGRLAGGIAEEYQRLFERLRHDAEEAVAGSAENLSAFAHLRQVLRGTERGQALTERLRSLSVRTPTSRRLVDLARWLELNELPLRTALGARVALETTVAPDLAPARVDPDQLREVLLQLAVNAREAMPEGGTFSVVVDAAEPPAAHATRPEAVRLRVADTGVGMSDEVQRHVFEPFFTTRPDGDHDGLGLAIVYNLVHQNGGKIEVRSRPGQGTVFEILLPTGTRSASGPEAVAPAPAGTEPDPHAVFSGRSGSP